MRHTVTVDLRDPEVARRTIQRLLRAVTEQIRVERKFEEFSAHTDGAGNGLRVGRKRHRRPGRPRKVRVPA